MQAFMINFTWVRVYVYIFNNYYSNYTIKFKKNIK